MKYFISVLIMTLLSVSLNAVLPDTVILRDSTVISKTAEYPGGEQELIRYLSLNLRYPNEALEHRITGEVWVRFMIDENGRISDVAIEKGIGWGCDEEAVKVVKEMSAWRPAYQPDGRPVKMLYRLPVVFELTDTEEKK